ncbi:MAG: YciI family protein [Desulfotalea sp.]
MFIISLEYIKQLEEVEDFLEAHVKYLKEQYVLGHFIASGRKVPRTGGVILSNIKTREKLEVVLAKDPFYQHGIATYDINEFIPSMVAEGYEMLKGEFKS